MWNSVQAQRGQFGDMGKILIEGEQLHVLFQGDCCNERVDGGQADAAPTGEAENASGGAISRQPTWLDHLPHSQEVLHYFYFARKTLQDLTHDNAGECNGFALDNQSTQFRSCGAR
ncbi:hypothetical protein SBA2_60014 [Acidobacteriia bacterium SbA2]|nr:hypothetical protein SBA2_60014 [Acidobacteriia bacterium SbA2]